MSRNDPGGCEGSWWDSLLSAFLFAQDRSFVFVFVLDLFILLYVHRYSACVGAVYFHSVGFPGVQDGCEPLCLC